MLSQELQPERQIGLGGSHIHIGIFFIYARFVAHRRTQRVYKGGDEQSDAVERIATQQCSIRVASAGTKKIA